MGKNKRKGKPLPKPPQTAHDAAVRGGMSQESGLAHGVYQEQSNMAISGGAKMKRATKQPGQSENQKGKASDLSPVDELCDGRKKQTSLKEIEQFRSCLKKMSEDEKQGLLRLSIRNLRERVGQMKHCSAKTTFLAALDYFEEHKTWECWFCSLCDVRYADQKLPLQHLAEEHGWNFLLEFDEIESKRVDDEWADMIVNGTWKPVDITRAMLKIQEKSMNSKKDLIEGCVDLHENCRCPDKQIWPLSNNPEHAKVLEQIHSIFKQILCGNSLAKTLIDSFINFTMDHLRGYISAVEFLSHGLDRTPLCICFLTGSPLLEVAKILQTLHVGLALEKNTDAPDKCVLNHRILITDDSLQLHLEKKLLWAVGDSGATCTISDDDETVLGEDNAFLCWLYLGPSIQGELEAWERFPETLKQLAKLHLKVVDVDLEHLQALQKKKSDIQNSIIATESIKNTVEEFEERKQGAGLAPQSFASILSRRLEELVMTDVEAKFCEGYLEIEAIQSILKASEKGFNTDQFDNDDPLAPARRCLEGIDDEPIEDRCIRIAIQRRLEDLSLENLKADAFILRTVALLRREVASYVWASVLDYQTIMESLLKPFVQEKFEVKKADIAGKMLLDELAAEAEKNVNTRAKCINLPAGKSKTKKKIKYLKKAKGSQGDNLYKLEEKEKDAEQAHLLVGDGLNKLEEEHAEQGFFPLGDGPNSGTSATAVRSELEQVLERQRQIENEAKQKQQADHERKIRVGSKSVSVFGDYRKNLEADELELQQEEKSKSETEFEVEENKKATAPKFLLSVGDFDILVPISHGEPSHEFSEGEEHRTSSTDVATKYVCGSNELVGAGLKNDGEFNCFLNVIVQSLWNLRRFRDEFLMISKSMHLHVRDACVVCALHDIFNALSAATSVERRESISTISLRVALNKSKNDRNVLQEKQMNDPSEVLVIILECIHHSFSWECAHDLCIAHKFFGINIHEEERCVTCGTNLRNFEYTGFYHFVNALQLRLARSEFISRTSMLEERESHFDELLRLVQVTDKRTCDSDERGCDELNESHYMLSTSPPVFIIVLVWQSGHESACDISATLEALDTKIDLAAIYEGFDAGEKHHLVSIVCYYGQHYICFAHRPEIGGWTLYDDERVQDVGSWEDVILMCEIRLAQPLVLFFEEQ